MDDRYAEFPEDLRQKYMQVETMLEHGSLDEALAALMNLPSEEKIHPLKTRLLSMIRERADDDGWLAAARRTMLGNVGGVCKMSETGHMALFSNSQLGSYELSNDRSIAEQQMLSAGIAID